MKQFKDMNEYRKYLMLQRALHWKRKIEENREKDTFGGCYS